MATALDCAIRDFETKEFGFSLGESNYYNYMSNRSWSEFLRTMDKKHVKQYGDGAGGELHEGQYPPKMASFGSSSRMIYELSKDIRGFIFEEKLDTRIGGVANIDGLLRIGNEYIYVEAKKREIYGSSHLREDIKNVYLPVYDAISKKCGGCNFKYEKDKIKNSTKQDKTKITFYLNNEINLYFDLKQLICHFLGITYDLAKHSVKNAKITFLYLLYNPESIKNNINEKYREKILKRYVDVTEYINKNINIFKSIFEAVLQYQIGLHSITENPDIDFEFKLVSQRDYKKELGAE